jgi:hypothetical protein
MREKKKRHEHYDWISQSLRPGDQVQIAYVDRGRGSRPRSRAITDAASVESIEAELEKLRAQFAEFEARAASEPPLPLPTWTRAPRPRMLKVSIGRRTTDARLDNEEQLQAVFKYTSRSCVLAVDAMTVQEDGSTKGTQWLRQELRLGQQVKITYAT